MARPFPARRREVLAALAAATALCVAPPAAAEIFKCTARDGSPLYQNFPCDIDSLGSLPASPAGTPSVPGGAGQPAAAAPGAPSIAQAPSGEPRVGMTGDEVRSLLGDPESAEDEEPAGERISTWRYANGRTLHLDRRQRVVAIQLQH